MYDLWLTLGTAVKQPGLLDTIIAAGVKFNRVIRITIETSPTTGTNVFQERHAAGLLEPAATTKVRQAIRDALKGKGATPITIFTAGRFCQFLSLSAADFNPAKPVDFKGVVNGFHAIYRKASATGPADLSAPYTAFLGACLVDGTLSGKVQAPDTDLAAALVEFGVDLTTPEGKVVAATINDPDFDKVQASFLTSPTWEVGCHETLFFWVGKNEHAV